MWVTEANQALLTDLYQLTMLQAYFTEGMDETAVFSLFVRRLPEGRNHLLAAGLDDALHYLETLRFDDDALSWLATVGPFREPFLRWLGELRFTGEVRAVAEGTPIFAEEPILEVRAPIAEAQLAETFVMNQVHLQTMLASKAARVVRAAGDRDVVDFGLRRIHGTDAGLKAARAFHLAGVAGTSNVLAAKAYGLRPTGTMAHSYVQAHDDEVDAFRAFAGLYPETVLLVDTYDTLQGVRRVVRLVQEGCRVGAVRLDSGDLGALARGAREILDAAGLHEVRIFASGGLDEEAIAALADAPIDAYGVGTDMGTSRDAPSLDIVYKLVAYGGQGRVKLSPGKRILPGAKQVFRQEDHDVLGRDGEDLPGRPLLRTVMAGGRRTAHWTLDEARAHAAAELARLPERIRALEPADPPWEVRLSDRLLAEHAAIKASTAPAPAEGRGR